MQRKEIVEKYKGKKIKEKIKENFIAKENCKEKQTLCGEIQKMFDNQQSQTQPKLLLEVLSRASDAAEIENRFLHLELIKLLGNDMLVMNEIW